MRLHQPRDTLSQRIDDDPPRRRHRRAGPRPGLLLILGLLVSACALALPGEMASDPAPPTALAVPSPTRARATASPSPTASPTPTASPSPTASPTPTAPPLTRRFTPRADDKVTRVAPGAYHIRRVTGDPLRINVVLFDLTAPQFDLRVALGEGWLSGRHRTSALAREQGALAAVNGDLFSENGLPQGLTIVDSQVVIAPKRRATFAWSRANGPFIGYFTEQWTWEAEVTAADGARAPLTLLNTPCPQHAICLFNHAARHVPGLDGDVRVVLDRRGRVTDIVRGRRLTIGPGAQVLQGTGQGARWLLTHAAAGDQMRIDIRTEPRLADYTQAISGGPIILRDGAFVQDCMCALRDCRQVTSGPTGSVCEDFSTDWKEHHYLWVRMPRTGIGFDRKRQTLIVAVVDGYQRGYSRGMTQEEFAALLREFGADTAMELDGGGSATMVLEGKVVNRPPDTTGERYVANALLFFWSERAPSRNEATGH